MARQTTVIQGLQFLRFQYLIYRHFVRLLGPEVGPAQGLFLHRRTQGRGEDMTFMPPEGFEATIPKFEMYNPVHALDCAVTAIRTN
jgi:hypothetical protein